MRNIFNKNSFVREIIKYGILKNSQNQKEYSYFRHGVTKLCSYRRSPKDGLIKKELEELFPGSSELILSSKYIRSHAYNVSFEELLSLATIVAYTKPKIIFEFGTFDGRTTYHLAVNAPIDARVYSIDIQTGWFEFDNRNYNEKIKVGAYVLDNEISSKVTFITGDTKKLDLRKHFNAVDLIFIDGDHSYEGVYQDTLLALKLLKQNGIIVWHDYNLIDGVTNAIIKLNKDLKDLVNIKNTNLAVYKKISNSKLST